MLRQYWHGMYHDHVDAMKYSCSPENCGTKYDSVAECGTKYGSVAAVYEVTSDRQNSHKWLEPARGVKTILRKFLQYSALFKSHLCLSTKFTHGQFGAAL